MNFINAVEKFKEYIYLKKLSNNTLQSYVLDLKQFYSFFNFKNINEFEKLDTRQYRSFLAKLRTENITAVSVKRKLSTIKSFATFLQNENLIKTSAVFMLENPKTPKKLPCSLSEEEIEKFLTHIKNQGNHKQQWQNFRDYLIAKLMFIYGMRISEVLSLKKDIISQDTIYIQGKGSKERTLPMLDLVKKELQEYKEQYPYEWKNNEFLFNSNLNKKYSPRQVQDVFLKTKLALNFTKDITPHKMRHSCATLILQNGGNIRQIQDLLGHSSLSTTQIYTKVSKQHLNKKVKSIIS